MVKLRLTWLDVLVVAALVVVAFTVGRVGQGLLVEMLFPPTADVDVEHVELLRVSEDLQTLRERLAEVRGRIADEDAALTTAVANLGHVPGPEFAKARTNIETHRRSIVALNTRSAELVGELADAEARVSRAERVERAAMARAQLWGACRDLGVFAGATFVALLVMHVAFVRRKAVLVVAAPVLLVLLLTEVLGWIAVAGGALVVVLLLGRKPA